MLSENGFGTEKVPNRTDTEWFGIGSVSKSKILIPNRYRYRKKISVRYRYYLYPGPTNTGPSPTSNGGILEFLSCWAVGCRDHVGLASNLERRGMRLGGWILVAVYLLFVGAMEYGVLGPVLLLSMVPFWCCG